METARNQILVQIYMVNAVLRFNTLDNQKEGKHSYFSLELLDEEICYGITHTQKKNNNNNNQRCRSHCFVYKSKMTNPFTSVYVFFELNFGCL